MEFKASNQHLRCCVAEALGPISPKWLHVPRVPIIVTSMWTNDTWMLRAIAFTTFAGMSSAHISSQSVENTGWPTYGNDFGGSRFSAATPINRTNVSELNEEWTYRTGANDTPTKLMRKAAFEATPILVDWIGPTFQFLRQFVQPSFLAIRFDVLERLIVYSGYATIGLATLVGKT